MGGHPSKAQNKGTTRLKQVQRAKIPESKAQSPPTHSSHGPCSTNACPLPDRQNEGKAFILHTRALLCCWDNWWAWLWLLVCWAPCSHLGVISRFLRTILVPAKKNDKGRKQSLLQNGPQEKFWTFWCGSPAGMEIHGTCHGNPPAPKTLTCWLQASNEISTLLGSQTCCQQHLCFLKKRT